ncbi:MAG TPA: RNA polymerase sigma-54 factor [Arcobacter sp.]|nr:RNA polymerase sigma-54 factor [Arcobacter sp.]
MALALHTKQKQTLQLSLKMWLPILQAPISELDNICKEKSYENPFLEYQSSFESLGYSSDEKRGFIENTSLYEESFQDKVSNQIYGHLFPTPNSQKVAEEILFYINNEGYFEGSIEDIAIKCNTTNEFVESIRQRFAYLEPSGIGAVDMKESFHFQLSQLDINDELSNFTSKLIDNLKNVDKFHKHHLFHEGLDLIGRFNTPPAVEYQSDQPYIIPDFFVDVGDDINVRINNSYYPDITVNDPFSKKNDQLKTKLKEARDMVNFLNLRKSTLYKLVLIIVEKQIGFFIGSELKPLTMAQVASELGFEESTISRAVSNKYIKCDRGTFSLKSFFTNAVSKDLSSAEIKSFIQSLIDNESHEQPLTDQDLVDMVMKRYDMKMVRRTITKYRKLLDIPSSKERKKFYKIA